MKAKFVICSTFYILLFFLLVLLGLELRDRIDKARLTQEVEPQIIYGTVEELK
jgi:hypothetical protein